MLRQRTLGQTVCAKGIGLHSGVPVSLCLRPAPADHGIVFRRVDVDPPKEIRSNAGAVGDTRMASTISEGDIKVATVEHLMSALSGLGIDNAIVEVDAAEIPIMDGSAATFVYLRRSAGVEEQRAPKRFVEVLEPVEVREGENGPGLSPSSGFAWNSRLTSSTPRSTPPASMF